MRPVLLRPENKHTFLLVNYTTFLLVNYTTILLVHHWWGRRPHLLCCHWQCEELLYLGIGEKLKINPQNQKPESDSNTDSSAHTSSSSLENVSVSPFSYPCYQQLGVLLNITISSVSASDSSESYSIISSSCSSKVTKDDKSDIKDLAISARTKTECYKSG